jgi:hypothetical protein
MANKDGHRRFGNVRKRESGRYQIRYPGPDGRMRTGSETYARKSDADRALPLTEAAIVAGEWTDPERGRVGLGDYAASWIAQSRRPVAAGIKDLMARMGHDSERAALIYQHRARGARTRSSRTTRASPTASTLTSKPSSGGATMTTAQRPHWAGRLMAR